MHQVVWVIAGSLLVLATLHIVNNIINIRPEGCSVIITGESVKFFNCVFDEKFIEFAKSVKAINHRLS
ncbi:triple gene block protein 3 [Banana virus X]|uniref:Movement protein TGBp3 n=1 Tax=Banana virus X TaxID=307671 RepID=Q5IJQ1_9VIRU|nr:triple gene block protein 3 [Banana virus X]AAW50961.1 triple gene block protein 3 [Banana virus X]